MSTVTIQPAAGESARTAELPADIFDVPVNIPLIHQVVVAQLAAARQGTASTKTRGEVSGGGKKPYRQKGTGRARQGSIRAPQFAGGGIVHGPTPRNYEQKTPKKMKAAALRGALSDRARDGRVHVVAGIVTAERPSTKAAVSALLAVASSKHVLVVAERADEVTWKSLRNVPTVHLIAPGQLNTYDVLVSDDVVFTEAALAEFLARAGSGRGTTPVPAVGTTTEAGAGVSTEQISSEVLTGTDSNLLAETAYETEGADVPTASEVDGPAAGADGDPAQAATRVEDARATGTTGAVPTGEGDTL